MTKIKVLVADDHPIVAEGLRSLLEPTYELVAIAENGHGQYRMDVIEVSGQPATPILSKNRGKGKTLPPEASP